MSATSRELTIQIVAALAAAAILAWWSSRKNSQSVPDTSALPGQLKNTLNQNGTVDDGSPGGVDTLSVNWGVSGAVSPVPISFAPITASNLPVTVPQSNQVPDNTLASVLNSPTGAIAEAPVGVPASAYQGSWVWSPELGTYVGQGAFN